MTERGVCVCVCAHLFKLFVENFAYGIRWLNLPSQNRREHVPQRDHAQNLPTGRKPETRLSHTFLHLFLPTSVRSFCYFWANDMTPQSRFSPDLLSLNLGPGRHQHCTFRVSPLSKTLGASNETMI